MMTSSAAQCLKSTGTLVETIVTTVDEAGSTHVAALGPFIDVGFQQLLLRPFQSTVTFANLKRTRQGVLHITDDVELIARAALGKLTQEPPHIDAVAVEGRILTDACRWYAFEIDSIDVSNERSEMLGRVVDHGRFRDFLGMSRAKHAVVEAAIVATRLHLIPADTVEQDLARLATIVDKTAGPQERDAFALVHSHIAQELRAVCAETTSAETT